MVVLREDARLVAYVIGTKNILMGGRLFDLTDNFTKAMAYLERQLWPRTPDAQHPRLTANREMFWPMEFAPFNTNVDYFCMSFDSWCPVFCDGTMLAVIVKLENQK